jgi:hypothetical protein
MMQLAFFTLAAAARAGLGYDSPRTVATLAINYIDKASKQTSADASYLTGAIAIGTYGELAARLATCAVTQGAIVDAPDFNFFLAAKNRLLEGNAELITQVGTMPRCFLCRRCGCSEKALKNVAQAAEAPFP